MSLPRVVSREEWLTARKELLAEEKAMTRARDELNAQRRMLPMVRIEKDYVFHGPEGDVEPARPLRRPPPADRQALHVRADLGDRLPELHRRRRRALGRASPATCTHARRRSSSSPGRRSRSSSGTRPSAGWTFPFYSSHGSDFNYDFHVTLDESVAPVEYNYRTKAEHEAAGTTGYVEGERADRAARRELLPARRRSGVPHLLRLRARRRGDGRLVLLPRPDGAGPPGGVGGAEGPGGRSARRDPRLRYLNWTRAVAPVAAAGPAAAFCYFGC